jgi:YD repeat-containing protein
MISRDFTTKVAVALALLVTPDFRSEAVAQQRQFYDAAGRNAGRATTDTQGSTTFYDSAGRVTGRASTGSNGTTTVYGADGRRTGTITGPPRR